MKIKFHKYHGTGNDFILIDDRNETFKIEKINSIPFLCNRNKGIGADGLILLRKHKNYDFEMIYFNSDGNESSMCGNGARCMVSFARSIGINKENYTFLACDGAHEAKIIKNNISIKMKDVDLIENYNHFYLDTGSPHVVLFENNLSSLDIINQSREFIKSNKKYISKGVNINYVSTVKENSIRTYERGVNNETLSCGTGAVAVALVLHYSNRINNEIVKLNTKGGSLEVKFKYKNKIYSNVWLTGEAKHIYDGEINI